jgi:hypothetical protein
LDLMGKGMPYELSSELEGFFFKFLLVFRMR